MTQPDDKSTQGEVDHEWDVTYRKFKHPVDKLMYLFGLTHYSLESGADCWVEIKKLLPSVQTEFAALREENERLKPNHATKFLQEHNLELMDQRRILSEKCLAQEAELVQMREALNEIHYIAILHNHFRIEALVVRATSLPHASKAASRVEALERAATLLRRVRGQIVNTVHWNDYLEIIQSLDALEADRGRDG